MKSFTHALAFVALSFAFAGCAKKDAPASSGTFNNSTVLSGSVVSSASSLAGSGTVVFNTPLTGIQSKNSYALAFSLGDGGSLTLQANSNNQVASGVALRFSRAGATLNVALISGGAQKDVSSKFAAINASSAMTMQIDVHNDESPAHVIVWSGTDFSESAALLNSEEGGYEAAGAGNGSFWGLVLANATVTKAQVGAPKLSAH